MKQVDFETLTYNTMNKCADILTAKGKDYSQGIDDRLCNFKSRATLLSKSPAEVLLNDLSKHFDSIVMAVIANPYNPSTQTEPLDERIHDAINYLILLKALLSEVNS